MELFIFNRFPPLSNLLLIVCRCGVSGFCGAARTSQFLLLSCRLRSLQKGDKGIMKRPTHVLFSDRSPSGEFGAVFLLTFSRPQQGASNTKITTITQLFR